MSKRDFDKYYDEVKKQYLEMISTLEEMTELADKKMIAPEMLDNVKATVEPIKQNYMTLSYVMFLLNTPKKGKKLEKYKRQNRKLFEQSIGRQAQDIEKENKEHIDKLKSAFGE